MITELLRSHRNAPVPADAQRLRIGEVDLGTLQARVTELAEAYLERGRLGADERATLARYVAALRREFPEVPGPSQSYVARLHGLAAALLDEAPPSGP